MPDMLALISKAVFEKDFPKAKLGQVLPLSAYHSQNKHLHKLDPLSRLFLVTVRPKGEVLWLCAVLDAPVFDGTKWTASPNQTPIVNLRLVKKRLKFENGKGLPTKFGALGMSLQTPRELVPEDAALLLAATVKVSRPYNLAVHQDDGPLPCLCKLCFADAPERLQTPAGEFVRAKVEAADRVLHFWVPESLLDELGAVEQAVRTRLEHRLKPSADTTVPSDLSEDDDDDSDDDDDHE
ncbi:MAG TPA: hypothetical protein PKE31_19460 [Pseudomonadota bacterium]|nr:hypothetical protein [Pseudomonadota bacterium]